MHTIEKKLALLEDTVKYYSENTERRCVETDNLCSYSPENVGNTISEGCAIGRLLTPEIKERLDIEFGALDVRGFRILPVEIKGYGLKLLQELQNLHDRKEHWNTEGLTAKGLYKVEEIKKMIRIKKA